MNREDRGCITIIGLIASLIGIFVFITGWQDIWTALRNLSGTEKPVPTVARSVSSTPISTRVIPTRTPALENTWESVTPPVLEITSLVIDPQNGNVIYAGTSGYKGVFKSIDGGKSWTAINNGLGDLDIRALVIAPSTPQVLYALTKQEAWKTTDGGKSWVPFQAGGCRGEDLGIAPNNSNVLYGIPWCARYASVVISLSGYDTGVREGSPGDYGLYKSLDGGKSWKRIDTFPINRNSSPSDVAICQANPEVVYVIMNDYQDKAAVFRSTNGGQSWWQTASIGQNYMPKFLIIDSTDCQTVYVGTPMGVYKTADGGEFWKPVNNGLPNQGHKAEVSAIVNDPVLPQVVYVALKGWGIYKTTDGAESWMDIGSGLSEDVKKTVSALAISRTVPRFLYAGSSAKGVWRYKLP